MRHRGFKCIVYLNDFYLCAETEPACQQAYDVLTALLVSLGFTLNISKLVPPCTRLIFSGIEIDTCTQTLSIPQDKLTVLREDILAWQGKKSASKRSIQSLLGRMNWAAKCVRAARPYMRRFISVPAGAQDQAIFYLKIPLMRTGCALCPVDALHTLWDYFLTYHHKRRCFTYFVYGRLKCVAYMDFVKKVRSLVFGCGLKPDDYSGHSLRRGGCTWAWKNNMPTEYIMLQGDWRSISWLSYLEIPLVTRWKMAKLLAECSFVKVLWGLLDYDLHH